VISQTKVAPSQYEQQIQKDAPRVVKYLKTAAAKRAVDLHPDIAEHLQRYVTGKADLLFHTANGTPHLYGNLEDRWLTPRLTKLGEFRVLRRCSMWRSAKSS